MKKLAIHGGTAVIDRPLVKYQSIDTAEYSAVKRVLESGSLSGFYGSWGDEFLGGREVKAFEKQWGEQFNVPYVVSVNSATTGLIASMGALEISPGDEVIVPPYTMSATAMAPLMYGAIPVFADIDPNTFCISVSSVQEKITPKTKAIIAVNLFGHPCDLEELSALAKKHGIYLVEDNSQSPLAALNGKYSGTFGDIGVFSLNYHKHIHCGEGGMCVTSDSELSLRLQSIRNHAENIVSEVPVKSMVNMVGSNYRMTELSAAIGSSQLSRIDKLVGDRKYLAEKLSEGLNNLEGVTVPVVNPGCDHVYYVWAVKLDESVLGINREKFSLALNAEGFPHFLGYVKPLYMLPIFQKRLAIGRDGWPFNLTDRIYKKGLCPISERMYERELLCFETCAYSANVETIQNLVDAFRKVHKNRFALI